tara:strand:- start:671 stop:1144 length:474 start_codon:yes stop_codon:yes gene_type:complete
MDNNISEREKKKRIESALESFKCLTAQRIYKQLTPREREILDHIGRRIEHDEPIGLSDADAIGKVSSSVFNRDTEMNQIHWGALCHSVKIVPGVSRDYMNTVNGEVPLIMCVELRVEGTSHRTVCVLSPEALDELVKEAARAKEKMAKKKPGKEIRP